MTLLWGIRSDMRIKFLIILSVWFFLNFFFTPFLPAQENQERCLWVWSSTSKIIDDYFSNTDGTAREEFLSFCAAPHGNPNKKITKLFISAYDYMQFQPDRMRRFLADMNNRGYKVYVVISDPKLAMPTYNEDYNRADPDNSVAGSYAGCFNESFEKMIIGSKNVKSEFDHNNNIVDDGIIGIIPFQKGGIPSERFAGIMLDIEPYQLGHGYLTETPYTWEKDFSVVWRTYVYLLSFCRTKIDLYNNDPLINDPMEFSDAFSAAFQNMDDGSVSVPSKNLFDTIFEKVDFFTLMAYSDYAGDGTSYYTPEMGFRAGIIYWAQDVVAKAESLSKKCLVTVETTYDIEDDDDIDSKITFYDNDTTVLETELAKVYTNFGSSSGFGGFSIHSYADTSTPYRGYQNMLPLINKHAPIATIKAPNGLQADGINFKNSIDIKWDIYNPDNLNYNISLFYKRQNDTGWTSFHSISNISSSTKSGSYSWNTTSLQTTQNNRIFIKLEISYSSGDQLTTFDTTDYPIAINETANIDMNKWSETYTLSNIQGYPQGLQIIPGDDNDVSKGVLHAVYYYFYEGSKIPGVYYSKSVDWGKTWSNTQILTPDSQYTTDKKSTWPRKPVLAKKGKYIGVAWLENSMRLADKEIYNQIISAQFNDNDGNPSNWRTSKITVKQITGYPGIISVDFPTICMESNGTAHIAWGTISKTSTEKKSYIEYAKYIYQNGTWSLSGSSETVAEADMLSKRGVKTPSLCTTSNGVHAVWSEYKELTQESSGTETIFSETFNSYVVNTPPNSIANFPWFVYGGECDFNNTFIKGSGGDNYLRIAFNSPTGQGPVWVSFGLAQDSAWNPAKDFTNATISFRIRTNITPSTAIQKIVSVEITAQVQDTAGIPIYQSGVPLVSNFRLVGNNLKPLPATSTTFETYSFPVSDLRDPDRSWARPILTTVTKVQIGFFQTDSDIVASGYVEIDDFKAEKQADYVDIPPTMRIVTKTRTSSGWGSAVQIASHQYELTEDQRHFTPLEDEDVYPVYFPKIISFNNDLFCAWQLTKKGDAEENDFPQFSQKFFSKSINGGSSWLSAPVEIKNDADNDTNGYAPSISVVDKNNDGVIDSIQAVYVSELSNANADNIFGNLYFTESINGGSSWSERIIIVPKIGNNNIKEGILFPYNVKAGQMAIQFGSMPFIYSCPNGISITSWVQFSESNTDEKTENFKLRGINFLKYSSSPFADIIEGQKGFKITWDIPDKNYAPNYYNLYRVTDNDPSTRVLLNNGSPIYSLSYIDLSTEITGNHYYRYEVNYNASQIPSITSIGSNGIKLLPNATNPLPDLLIDDFEVDSGNNSYTGTTYKINNDYSNDGRIAMTYTVSTFSGVDTDRVAYIKYAPIHIKTPTNFYINFPTKMDFSNYGSINLWIKLKEGSMPRKMICNVYELLSSDSGTEIYAYYTLSTRVTLVDDGSWHLCRFYLDKFDEFKYPTLKNIKAIAFGFYEETTLNTPTEFYIDDIILSNTPVLDIDTASITSPPIENNGMIKGIVMNPAQPVNVNFGNGRNAWYLRIYTLDEMNNDGTPVKITKHGLIRKEGNIIYPQYNMPIKVWCQNFGPARFMNLETGQPTYYTQGYPPIENDYFFKGYNFNHDKEGRVWDQISFINPQVSSNKIVEGTGPGKYNFDIDGDGFHENDDFFGIIDRTDANFRDKLSESGCWLFVPMYKTTGPWPQERDQDLKDFVIMDPSNINTWRRLASYQNDKGNHHLKLYFAAYLGVEQCGYSRHDIPNDQNIAYGRYSGTVVIDLVYN